MLISMFLLQAESGLQDALQPGLEGDNKAREDEEEKDKELQAAREDQHDRTFEKDQALCSEEVRLSKLITTYYYNSTPALIGC